MENLSRLQRRAIKKRLQPPTIRKIFSLKKKKRGSKRGERNLDQFLWGQALLKRWQFNEKRKEGGNQKNNVIESRGQKTRDGRPVHPTKILRRYREPPKGGQVKRQGKRGNERRIFLSTRKLVSNNAVAKNDTAQERKNVVQ